MTRTVFDNRMLAHVWAQRTQDSGKSGNGNFYFSGPFLYSYGSHFLAGYALPDGRALLNGSRYSVSTSRHQSYAWGAVRGRAAHVPNLTEFARILGNAERLDSPRWPYPEKEKAAELATLQAQALELITRTGPKVKPTPPFNSRAVPDCDPFPVDGAAMILEALGMTPEKAARVAARAVAKRESNRKEWIAAEAAAKDKAALTLAANTAARPLAELKAELQELERSGRLNARLHGPQWEARARELFRAAKLAKSKGRTRVAAAVMAHYQLIRERVKVWPELEGPAEVRAEIRAMFQKVRAARALLSMPPAELGRAEVESPWHAKPSRVIGETLAAAHDFGLITVEGRREPTVYRVDSLFFYMRHVGQATAEHSARWLEFAAALRGIAERLDLAEWRELTRGRVAAIRAFKEADPETVSSEVATAARRAAHAVYSNGAANPPKGYRAWVVAGWTHESFVDLENRAGAAERAALTRERAARAAETAAWEAERAAAWVAGLPEPEKRPGMESMHVRWRMDDGQGGALIRARDVTRDESGVITGGELETSQGARVPLTHAVRAFRFLKLCREKAASDPSFDGWQANGKSLPVGLFRVDSVDREGNFRAGCHRINWGEVARLAAELGLAELAPENTTEPTPGH